VAVSWVGPNAERPPAVRLVPAEERHVWAALLFSAQWLVVLAAAWAVTRVGVLRTLARWLWPEAVVLTGLAGWQVAGPTPAVLLVVLLGVVGRLVLVMLAVRRRMERVTRTTAGGSGVRG
jgi:hypothetical protein